MRRFWIMLLAVALALVIALPAGAGKPDKPDKPEKPTPEPPTTYAVTITMTNGSGIETTCDGSTIEMERTDARGGRVKHFEAFGAKLDIHAGDLALGDESIGGCHGAVVFPEYFRITLDGSQVAMLWIFDVGETELEETHPVKGTTTEIVRTDLRMGGPYDGDDFATWGYFENDEGVFTTAGVGMFSFVQYVAGRDPMFTDLKNGLQDFALEITLDPND